MKDNCFNEFDPNALNVEEALSRILKSIASKKDTELVPLKESYGRVLAKDIKSNQDIPNYKNSAMDGYAVCMDDTNVSNKSHSLDASANFFSTDFSLSFTTPKSFIIIGNF